MAKESFSRIGSRIIKLAVCALMCINIQPNIVNADTGADNAAIFIDSSNNTVLKQESDFAIGKYGTNSFMMDMSYKTSVGSVCVVTIPYGFGLTGGFANVPSNITKAVSGDYKQAGGTKIVFTPSSVSSAELSANFTVQQYPTLLVNDISNNHTYDFTVNTYAKSDTGFTTPLTSSKVELLGDTSQTQYTIAAEEHTWSPYEAAYNRNITYSSLGRQSTGYHFESQMVVDPTVTITKTAGIMTKDSKITMELPYKNFKNTAYNSATNPNGYNNQDKVGNWYPTVTPYILYNGNWYNAGGLLSVKVASYTSDGYASTYEISVNEGQYDSFGSTIDSTKTNLEILSGACTIQLRASGEIEYEDAYKFLTNQPEVGYVSSTKPSISYSKIADGTTETVTADKPMVFKVENDTDNKLEPSITVPTYKIPMGSTTTTSYESRFNVSCATDYAILQNVKATYTFPYEYSPVSFNLYPNTAYQKDDFNYTFTISDKNGVKRTENVTYATAFSGAVGSNYTYEPTLASGEWVSKVELNIPEYWKSEQGNETGSVLAFTAKYRATETDETGASLTSPYTATLNGATTADGVAEKTTSKTVTLDRVKDNLVYYTYNKSSLHAGDNTKVNIGYYNATGGYDLTTVPFTQLYWYKYADTQDYNNGYFELTGDALAFMKGIDNVTSANSKQYYLPVTAYRLETGDWIDVSSEEADAWEVKSGTTNLYADFTKAGIDFSQHYLTGVRLSTDYLNDFQVTSTSGQQFGMTIYLHYSALPTDAAMKTLGAFPQRADYASDAEYYTACDSWQKDQPYEVKFSADGNAATTNNLSTTMVGSKYNAYSSTMQVGAIANLTSKDNNYYVTSNGGMDKSSELCQAVYADSGSYGTVSNQMAYIHDSYWNFNNDTDAEKAMLALTKGVTLTSNIITSKNYRYYRSDLVWYKTNLSSEWKVIDSTKYTNTTGYGGDRVWVPLSLSDGEYVTALQVHPSNSNYLGLTYGGYWNKSYQTKIVPNVGLSLMGKVPASIQLDNGDTYTFTDGEQLPYEATMTASDILGRTTTKTLTSSTAKLNVANQNMEVFQYVVQQISYASKQTPNTEVNQGSITTAKAFVNYYMTNAALDGKRTLRPAFYFQIDKDFSPADLDAIAKKYNANVTFNKLSSGDGILKIQLTEDSTGIANNAKAEFDFDLRARSNAQTGSVTPIVDSWMDVDYDSAIPYDVNNYSVSMTTATDSKYLVHDTDGSISGTSNKPLLRAMTSTGTALTYSYWTTTVMQFLVTGVNTTATAEDTGYSSEVSNHDNNQNNIFGMNQVLGGATDVSTGNWSIYIKLPQKGETSAYYDSTSKVDPFLSTDESDYTMVPYEPITVTGVSNAVVLYSTKDSPSMIGLTSASGTETTGDWQTWDDIKDKNTIKCIKLYVPTVGIKEQIAYDIPLRLKDRKETVGTQYAYPSIWYNYERDGELIWHTTDPLANGGGMCGKLTYDLLDYKMSSSLFCDNNKNNILDKGDTLGGADMTVALQSDATNTPVKNNDGTDYIYKVGSNGQFNVSIPRQDSFSLIMTPPARSVVSEYHAANGNASNWSWFTPNAEKTAGVYKATVTGDVTGILGGYIPPQPLDVSIQGTKTLSGAGKTTADITENQFSFTVTRTDTNGNEVTGLPTGNITAAATTGALDFGTWEFLDPGTYTFKISENTPAVGYTKAADVTVNVVVTLDKSTNTLSKTVTYSSGDTLTFANTYTAPDAATVSIDGTKTLQENSSAIAIKDNQFKFAIAADAGNDTTGYKDFTAGETNVKADGTFTFGGISFTKPGTYVFTASEVNEGAAGYTYDAKPVTITYTTSLDTATNKIIVNKTEYTKDGQSVSGISFDNTYTTPDPMAFTFSGNMTLTGADKSNASIKAGQFSASITADAANDASGYTGFTAGSADCTAGGGFSFGALTFKKAGTYNFTITDVNKNAAGYTYDANAVNAKVEVTLNPKTNTYEATVTYTKGSTFPSSITLDHSYTAPDAASASIDGTKTLKEGTAAKAVTAGQFSFSIAADKNNDTNGYPDFTTTEASVDASGKFSFGSIIFVKAGTYTFTVSERNNGAKGYTYDSKPVTVTYTVTLNETTNKLEITNTEYKKDGASASAITFSNNYESPVPADVSFAGQMNLTGGEKTNASIASGQFSTLITADAANDTTGYSDFPAGSLDCGKGGGFKFDRITFTKAGTYNFTISDVDKHAAGYTYDSTPVQAKVVVSLNTETNALKTAVTYTKGTDTITEIALNNTYTMPAAVNASITGTKALHENNQNKAMEDGQFTFSIAADPSNNTSGYTGIANGDVNVNADGTFNFGNISFLKAGTYLFTISENQLGAAGYTYDAEFATVSYTVTLHEDTNTLSVSAPVYTKNSSAADAITFGNEYETPAPINFTFNGQMNLSGGEKTTASIPAGQFSASITASSENDASGYTGYQEGSTDCLEGGSFAFDKISFTKAGTYQFTIKEDDKKAAGYTYDTKEITADVDVKLNRTTNTFETVVTYTPFSYTSPAVSFDNTYTYPDPLAYSFDGNTTLDGQKKTQDITAGQFDFSVTSDPENNASGFSGMTDSALVEAGGVVNFSNLSFTKPGTYKFELTQDDLGKPGYTYDKTIYEVTFEVTLNPETNQFEIVKTITDASGKKEDAVTFTNTYMPAPVEDDPPVSKTIVGSPAEDSEFSFTLQASDSTEPMPEGSSEGIKEVKHIGAGSVEFGTIAFTKPGTYEYSITETNTGIANYTYDAATYKVVYVVTDNNGKLEVSRTITADNKTCDSASFTNIYTEPSVPEKNIPDTGDHTNIPLACGMMVGSLLAAAFVLFFKKHYCE